MLPLTCACAPVVIVLALRFSLSFINLPMSSSLPLPYVQSFGTTKEERAIHTPVPVTVLSSELRPPTTVLYDMLLLVPNFNP
jgi:hypothetical protein